LFFPEAKFDVKNNRIKVPLGSEKKHLFCPKSLGFFSGSRVNQQRRFTGGRARFSFYYARQYTVLGSDILPLL